VTDYRLQNLGCNLGYVRFDSSPGVVVGRQALKAEKKIKLVCWNIVGTTPQSIRGQNESSGNPVEMRVIETAHPTINVLLWRNR